MNRISLPVLVFCLLFALPANADLLDRLREYRAQKNGGSNGLDANTVASGLKEALSVGARNSVASVAKTDGYFGNRKIRIPMPEKMQKTERLIRKVGFNKEADRFILSMNRAAERAAPRALGFFVSAVKEMTIPDAMQVLRGTDTAATEFLKDRTYAEIYAAFKPVVAAAMDDVKVTRAFKDLMEKAGPVPFVKKESVDLDHYVTAKALDGLFVVLGQEEQKIRKDPAARVTDLLRKVFQ